MMPLTRQLPPGPPPFFLVCVSLCALGLTLLTCSCTGDLSSDHHNAPLDKDGPPSVPPPRHAQEDMETPPAKGDPDQGPKADPERLPVGSQTWVRLNRGEMQRSLNVAFGELDFPQGGDFLPADDKVAHLYLGNRDETPAPIVDKLLEYAEANAEVVVGKLDEVAPCAAKDEASACATAFVDRFAPLLWRRPIDAQTRQAHHDFIAQVAASRGYPEAVRQWVTVAQQSPFFVYIAETGRAPSGPGEVKLTGWEVAARLSFFLWRQSPNKELLHAAEAGELDHVEGIRTQATRMMKDKLYHDAMNSFLERWMDLNIPEENLGLPSGVQRSMGQETRQWLTAMGLEGALNYRTLISGSWSMVDRSLAEFYGVSHSGEDQWERVTLKDRPGFLTRGAVLISDTNDLEPIFRGRRVLESVLCRPMGEAVDLDDVEEEVKAQLADTSLSMRQRMSVLETGTCAACHDSINPLGYAYLQYDTKGRIRAWEMEGFRVDAADSLPDPFNPVTPALAFTDASDLADQLAALPEARRCFVRQALRFALRRYDTRGDQPSIDDVLTRATSPDLSLDELVLALVTSHSFRHTAQGATP